jgi:hypothetical protein
VGTSAGGVSRLVRKRNGPILRGGRPCVRARFDAVEIPLNRIKKSRNALKKFLFAPSAIENASPIDSVLCFYSIRKPIARLQNFGNNLAPSVHC